MTRSVNAQEYAEKRNAILDVAMRYIATKGYEQMTTQDILEGLQISRGAFYHYFESKQALLMGLVERIGEQAEQLVLPIVSDREMSAQDKLLRFFAVLDQHKRANKDLLFAFMRVWYADENALFRQKLYLPVSNDSLPGSRRSFSRESQKAFSPLPILTRQRE